MKKKCVRLITNNGYRNFKIVSHIKDLYGEDVIIKYASPDTTPSDVSKFIKKGNIIIIAVFDLHNELAYAEYHTRLNTANTRNTDTFTLVTNPSAIISISEIHSIVNNWISLCTLFSYYNGDDIVTCINGNDLMYDGTPFSFEYDMWDHYAEVDWFKTVFRDVGVSRMSNRLFGAIKVEKTTPPENVYSSIINETPYEDYEHIGDDDILICVQDIEGDVDSYIKNIVKRASIKARIYVYDIGSVDSTFEEITTMDINTSTAPQELRCKKILYGQLDRMDIKIAVSRLSALYSIAPKHSFSKGGSSEIIPIQFIESFCTVATIEIVREVECLIESIRGLYDLPIYIQCDTQTMDFLNNKGFTNIKYSIISDNVDIGELIPNRTLDNTFHNKDAIYRKMASMRAALSEHSNTMFLDADVILLKEIIISSNAELILSPHYCERHIIEVEYGIVNAGYIFTRNKKVPDVWEDIYRNKSKFYEQEGMRYFVNDFDVDTFPREHNIGTWRGHSFSHIESPVSYHIHTDPVMNSTNSVTIIFDTNVHLTTVIHKLMNINPSLAQRINYMNNNIIGNCDASIVVTNWGLSKKDSKIFRKILKSYSDQKNISFDIVFVELLFDDDESILSDIGFNGKHIVVNGNDNNLNINQREALFNIGVESVDSEYTIFIDNNILLSNDTIINDVVGRIDSFNVVYDGSLTTKKGNLGVYNADDTKYGEYLESAGIFMGVYTLHFNRVGGFPLVSPFGDNSEILANELFDYLPTMHSIYDNTIKSRGLSGVEIGNQVTDESARQITRKYNTQRCKLNNNVNISYNTRMKLYDYMLASDIDLPIMGISENGLMEWQSDDRFSNIYSKLIDNSTYSDKKIKHILLEIASMK